MLKKSQQRKIPKNNLEKVIFLNKKEGETPLQALETFRSKNKEYKDIPMSYAGRLDPMAEGLLLILAGDKIKEKDKYLSLDKEYEFQILFGFATDTYDILGKVNYSTILTNSRIELEKEIKKNLKDFKGHFIQKYPIYSSKTVKGKALFKYGREGKDVAIPEREVHVKKIKFLDLKKINSKKLLESIKKRIAKVKGDFRQQEIIKIWEKELSSNNTSFYLGSFVVSCGSGTYVRAIANDLGTKMSIPALAYSIKRTIIGKKKLFEL